MRLIPNNLRIQSVSYVAVAWKRKSNVQFDMAHQTLQILIFLIILKSDAQPLYFSIIIQHLRVKVVGKVSIVEMSTFSCLFP